MSGQNEHEVPWDSPDLFPPNEAKRIAKYRRLQSRYRHEVLKAKAGSYRNYPRLGSYLDASDVAANPMLNFLTPAALAHAEERIEQLRREGGTLDPARLRQNMLSSMPLCFNLFGSMRNEPGFLTVFRDLFDPEATLIRNIVCEWAPQPSSLHLGDRTAFDAVVFYETEAGPRFVGIETKYTEAFSIEEYTSPRYEEVTTTTGWFVGPDASQALAGRASNQLWRNLMLAATVEGGGEYGTGRVAVVSLADDAGARAALDVVEPRLSDPARLSWVSIESIVKSAADIDSLDSWASKFSQRYLG